MKIQLTTIAAAVAFTMSSAAMAQTTSPDGTFNGSRSTINNMAGPSYDGNPVGSDSYIDQTGDGNINTVVQWGTQISRIKQDGDNNSVNIDQDEIAGQALTDPGQHYSYVDQDGNRNHATVVQLDKYNDSKIYQEGNRNFANIDQDGELNDSWVKQEGNDNSSEVNQNGDLNDSYVLFEGNGNYSYTGQMGDELDSDIITYGDNNNYIVHQTGYGHDSFIRTNGSGNGYSVSQSGDFGTAGQHFSQIKTTGNNNYNSVSQGH